MYIAPKTIWTDFNGKVVEESAPGASHCVVQKGALLTEEEAQYYKTVTGEMPSVYESESTSDEPKSIPYQKPSNGSKSSIKSTKDVPDDYGAAPKSEVVVESEQSLEVDEAVQPVDEFFNTLDSVIGHFETSSGKWGDEVASSLPAEQPEEPESVEKGK